MKLAITILSIGVISLTACKRHQATQPSSVLQSDTSRVESQVYRAFIADHLEDDWKTYCAHAVLDTELLQPDKRDPTPWFELQAAKPSRELTEHFLEVERNEQPLGSGGNQFFIQVNDAVLLNGYVPRKLLNRRYAATKVRLATVQAAIWKFLRALAFFACCF